MVAFLVTLFIQIEYLISQSIQNLNDNYTALKKKSLQIILMLNQ